MKELNTFHHEGLQKIAFSPDEKYIISYNGDLHYAPTSEVKSLFRTLSYGRLKVDLSCALSELKRRKLGKVYSFPPVRAIWPEEGIIKFEFTSCLPCNWPMTVLEINSK